MKKVTIYILLLLVLPVFAYSQTTSGITNTKKVKVCQFKTGIELTQKSPNQLNPLATVGFTLTKASKVSLIICDAYDKEIVTLLDLELSAGYHTVQHYVPAISEGKYYYSFIAEANGRKIEQKVQMLL